MSFIMSMPLRICTKKNQIPDSVLTDILKVYEFGKAEHIKSYPNDLICTYNGAFWTTWTKIFKLREEIIKMKKEL